MIEVQDWGLIDYIEAWQRQKELVVFIHSHKDKNIFIVCSHPVVITVGRSATGGNIVASEELLKQKGITVVRNDRGGDATLHNPGQLVGYMIFNLINYRTDLHWFLRQVEGCIIEILGILGINSNRIDGLTGVWIEGRRKICAMGFHCTRWITSHGFALNVCNDLSEFDYIVPCGIKDKEITSIAMELGTQIDFNNVRDICINVFKARF